jgi:hypothetical protein
VPYGADDTRIGTVLDAVLAVGVADASVVVVDVELVVVLLEVVEPEVLELVDVVELELPPPPPHAARLTPNAATRIARIFRIVLFPFYWMSSALTPCGSA